MGDRTALVTGATGFIGGHLVGALLAGGWQVGACGRRPRPSSLPEEVGYRQADLAADDLGPLLQGATHLFHLAGASSTSSNQEEMMRANVVGTQRLVAAVPAGLERVLHMSSTSVYGEEVQLPVPVPEDVELQPSRGYGKAKWGAEQAVWKLAERGVPVQVVRPVSVYGPGNVKLLGSAILDAAIERFSGLDYLVVPARAIEQRLVHVDDLVAACLHLVDSEAPTGVAYNVCHPGYPTSLELAGMVAAELGLGLATSDDPDCGPSFEERREVRSRMLAAGMTDDIVLTPERLRLMRKGNRNNRLGLDALLATGFDFRCPDLAAGIAGTVAWYLEHRWIL